MPFVTEFAGPRRPLESWPPLVAGGVRRTSTIDTHPDGEAGSQVELRARDVLAGPGGVSVAGDVALGARLHGGVIEEIRPIGGGTDDRLTPLHGRRVGPGFRAGLAELFPDEVRSGSLLHLLLDDWVGAALVSGYALQYREIELGLPERMSVGAADRMTGVCAGWAPDASMAGYAREHNVVPCFRGPVAPPLWTDHDPGMHPVRPLRADGMRRLRRIDLRPEGETLVFDAHFRDSHLNRSGLEEVVHEYTVTGAVDPVTRTVTRVDAQVRVLPWKECPRAVDSATRITGMPLAQLRTRVRTELVGTSTCTHLNDTLRALADLDVLADLAGRVRAR
ncbi:hypothetical protein C731_0656 [Mycolicibacterium hassiacum DSM 44199]|jgi:hypothetical protein|uniref:Uncharacterized protein n=1 Tax=Mycolicibacterium hassiacum (strain DSM 44199 / CIP 105218 / JCM 12690 / 3849) TaxID=1122247 RepID=K5BCM5_MYCHD|nr:DUF2889 domain-containing protein [Mycolicibacterium hassiacum]EKF25335.1 hypothetical protein C731_0656 [Mycolicibacterium hassiacum DSM 44199]MBX5487124.1 DUF2889 domain-containing protein [Mycolicibacterium hassiacum]MDA4085673.1 hypothetical protein [Mycolicibacterium hassiacum DSM 44199]PZN22655.1 MAG: DUF2889 domain-containing protein [Mycolicibacterium hassiacum]VCT93070.1 hypothetical protein MHAS_04808 [Mycolicibacterium hassiacum DSM 44199]